MRTLALLTLLALPGSALAGEAQWYPPQTIGGEHVGNTQMAMDRDGNTIVLFGRSRPPFDEVHMAWREAGGEFTEPRKLPWLRTSGVRMGGVATAFDWAGRLAFLWKDESENDLRYLIYDPDARTANQGTLVAAEDRPSSYQLRADARQRLYAAWWTATEQEGCCFGPTLATFRKGELEGEPEVIAEEKTAWALGMAVSRTGGIALAWPTYHDGFHAIVREPGKDFDDIERLEGAAVGLFGFQPQLAVDDDGGVFAAITSDESRFTTEYEQRKRIDFFARPPGGDFGDAKPVRVADGDPGELTVAPGPAGDAVITWTEPLDDDRRALRALIRSPDGSLSEPVTLASGNLGPGQAPVGVDAAGNALVVWAAADDEDAWTIYAAYRPRKGEFGESRPVSDVGVSTGQRLYPDPQLAVGGAGNAVVTWNRFAGDDVESMRTQAAVFDVKGPRLPDFGVTPPPAVPGRTPPSITFRWTVSEKSKALIRLRRGGQKVAQWKKASQPGANKLRVRASSVPAGRYTATVQATDPLGNTSRVRETQLRLRQP